MQDTLRVVASTTIESSGAKHHRVTISAIAGNSEPRVIVTEAATANASEEEPSLERVAELAIANLSRMCDVAANRLRDLGLLPDHLVTRYTMGPYR